MSDSLLSSAIIWLNETGEKKGVGEKKSKAEEKWGSQLLAYTSPYGPSSKGSQLANCSLEPKH